MKKIEKGKKIKDKNNWKYKMQKFKNKFNI